MVHPAAVIRRLAPFVVLAGLGVLLGLPFLRSAAAAPLAARGAVRLVGPTGGPLSGQWQSWANRSLVPTVTGSVTLRLTGCPGLPKMAGCVYTQQPRVIYVKPGIRQPRAVMLHELGHVYDLTVFSNTRSGPVPQDHAAAAHPLVERQAAARGVVRRGLLVVLALPPGSRP